MQTILVTVTGPGKSIDLEIPGELPLRELFPELLRLVGPRTSVGVAEVTPSWLLRFAEGRPLDPNRSLIESEVMDGALLVLQDSQALAREQTPPMQFHPPLVVPSRDTGGIAVYWNKEGFLQDT
jgi:hypothetical protein